MELFEKEFDKYMNDFDKNIKQIRYKYKHSYEVETLMEELSDRLNLSKKEKNLAKLIGLLHDLGRFPQIKKYNSCNDYLTGYDHAEESVKYLFIEDNIKSYIKTREFDDIIKDAIGNHNKLEIDKNVVGKNLLFSKMIRDMDKVDIYRVLSEEYSYTFNKDDISKKIKNTFEKKKQIKTKDIKTESDKVISYLSFIFDINFKESIEILKEKNNLEKFFKIVSVDNNSYEEFDRIKKFMYKYMEDVK